MVPHTPEERLDIIDGGGVDKGAVVEDQADPEVVHQDRKSCHNCNYTPRAAKFITFEEIRFRSVMKDEKKIDGYVLFVFVQLLITFPTFLAGSETFFIGRRTCGWGTVGGDEVGGSLSITCTL